MVDYYIENYSFKGFGIIVQESTGVVDLPKFKPPTEHDWAEYNGTIVDTEKTPRTEARQIQLKCALSAANQTDFLTKVSAFQSVFMTKGLKRLAIVLTHDVGLFFDVYMSDGLQITKRWRDSQMVGQFTVTLTEPEPRKKIIRYDSQDSTPLSISFKNTEAVSVYWGNGEYSQDLYGDVSLSHTYDEPGIYFAIIHGNIEELSEFSTNGEELGANNGGAIDIDVPEILNDALTNVELFTTAEPDVSTPLAPYLKFTFNNNSETRILRIAIDYSLSTNIDSVLSETSPNAVRNSAITAGINAKADKKHTHQITDVADLNSTLSNHNTRITNNATAITTINGKVGSANGIAQLDGTGKVPSSQLPGYVDDVREYASASAFPATGESGVIYVALDTNQTYRWSGSAYVLIGSDLALGETESTAYRGDRGKTAYDHSQTQGNPHNTTIAQISGLQTSLNGKQPKIGKNEFLKQVSDLDNYTAAQNGEIVEFVGATDSKYTHGYVYERDTSKDIAAGTKILHITNSESFPHNAQIVATNPIVIESGDYILDSTSDNHTITTYTVNRRINASYTHQGYIDCYGILTPNNTYLVWFRSPLTSMLIELSYTNNEWVDEEGKTYEIISSEQYTYKEYTFYNDNSKKVLAEQNDSDVYYYVQSFARIGGGSTNILIRTGNRNTIETSAEDVIFWQQTDVQPRTDITDLKNPTWTDEQGTYSDVPIAKDNIQSGWTLSALFARIKKWFSSLKKVAFSGSYNDLSNKPLSVENSKVKYTLPDGETKLTLIQESDYSNTPIEYTPDTTATRDAKDSTTLSGLKSYIEASNIEGIAASRSSEVRVISGNSGWYEIGEFYLHYEVSAIFDCYVVGNYGSVNWGSLKFTIVVNAFSANILNVINSSNQLTKVRLLTEDGTRKNPVTIEIYKNNNDAIIPRIRFVGLPTINTRYFVPHNDSKQVWLNNEYSITM